MASIARKTSHWNMLRHVPYETYVQLRDDPANDGVKMTYCNGTLEIVSPTLFEHERWSGRLDLFIRVLTGELQIRCESSGSTTFRREGETLREGYGKEPDQSYYLAHAELVSGNETIDLEVGDPPPDLWIEVDHRVSSRGRLPVYAGLGVPEVWRYRTKTNTLAFLGLVDGSRYEAIAHSLSLPMLTPAFVLEALALGEGLAGSQWYPLLRAWVRETLATS